MSIRILVALDESSFAKAAGEVALDLARRIPDAELEALSVLPVTRASGNMLKDIPGTLGFEPAIVSEADYDSHRKEHQALLDAYRLRVQALGGTVKLVLEEGAVAEVIERHARHADLVVMGLRGHTEERFPGQGGNTTGRLYSELPRLLLVPQGMNRLQTFCMGYDGSAGAAHAVTALRRVTEGWNADVHAIFVSEDGAGGKVLDELDEELPQQTLHKHVKVGDSPHEVIAAEARRLGADALVLGFKGSHPVRDLLFGSTSEHAALGQLDLAVLVAR